MIIKYTSKARHLFSDYPQVDSDDIENIPSFNTAEAIHSWSANYFEEEECGDKFLILFNEFIYTPMVFFLSDELDFDDFEKELKYAIEKTWRAYGIPQNFIDSYLQQNSFIECAKLTDKNSIGKLNSAIRDFRYSDDQINTSMMFQASFIKHYRRSLFKPTNGYALEGKSKSEYEFYSNWCTAKNLECGNYEKPEFPSYMIDLEYVESDERVLRRIEVPAFLSFEDLHKCIQIVYQWSDYHIWNFLIASVKGLEKPRARRLRSDNPMIPSIELEARDAQPEIDYAFDTSLGLKPLVRIEPDYESDSYIKDWMLDGVTNLYPTALINDFFEQDEYAIYSYDTGVGHTVKVHIVSRFVKDIDEVICTEIQGDARGEDSRPPEVMMDGTVTYSEDMRSILPFGVGNSGSPELFVKNLAEQCEGFGQALLLLLNEALRRESWRIL